MNPTPPDAGSPLATLRQLKEMLDAGAITQPEFDALKQRLIFGPGAEAAGADAPASPPSPAYPAPPAPAGAVAPVAAAEEPASPQAWDAQTLLASPAYAAPPADPAPPTAPGSTLALGAAGPPTPYLDTPAALTPEATPLVAPEPDWLAAPALLTPDEPAEPAEAAATERRNPLNLIFALGGLLLFLGVIVYITLGRHGQDEHVGSTSQTAADSVVVRPEEGPQQEQLTLPPIQPEVVREAQPAPAAPAPDSAATQFSSPPPQTAPAPTTQTAPAATTTAPEGDTPMATDSTHH